MDLTPTEWVAAEQVIEVLHAVEAVNTTLCGEQYVTLSWVVPMLSGLVKKSLKVKPSDKVPVPALKKALATSISE